MLENTKAFTQTEKLDILDKRLENASLANDSLSRDFLRFFDTNTFSLYETKDNFSTWNKLTLDPTNSLNPVIKTPCL